jgi:3-oxoacyl-[acyl-carrier protein] reductase
MKLSSSAATKRSRLDHGAAAFESDSAFLGGAELTGAREANQAPQPSLLGRLDRSADFFSMGGPEPPPNFQQSALATTAHLGHALQNRRERRMRLQGRVAIVTGAASGIGQATAQLFAREGARVLAVDLPGKGLAAAHDGQDGIATLEKNVGDGDAARLMVDTAVAKFAGLDIVMNNAGIGANALVEAMTQEQWDRVLNVNLTAQFRLCQQAIPHLKQSKFGRIINVASVMAEGTDYGLAAYCASKAGVAGLTRTLALELGKFGITANYLEPGAIQTGMTRPLWDARPEVQDIWAKKAALRRVGQPIDLARGALFLASDDGGFVTGHGLVIDGGLTLRI